MSVLEKIVYVILVLLALTIISSSIGLAYYMEKHPCKEYNTYCYYGTRNTHDIDCDETAPRGYTKHTVRSCIRR